MNLKGRSFLKLLDFTPEEILYLVDLAAELKDKKKKGISTKDMHSDKSVALIFEKTSTRTRCSFEVAAHDLGMGTTYLGARRIQVGRPHPQVVGRHLKGASGAGAGLLEDQRHVLPPQGVHRNPFFLLLL